MNWYTCVYIPVNMTLLYHYDDVIMSAIASQITSLTIVYSTVYTDADISKRQSSASLAFVWGIHRGPVNSPHKGPVTQKMFPFDDAIMIEDIVKIWTGKLAGYDLCLCNAYAKGRACTTKYHTELHLNYERDIRSLPRSYHRVILE